MLLEYKNLKIRNAGESDAKQLAVWWNDGRVMAHAGFPNGLGTTAEKVWEEIGSDSDDTRRRLIMEADNVPIGEMSYCNRGNKTAEIGIKICDFSMQDKGLGKILLSMLISYLFEEMGYEKIFLDTNLKNKRAQHVYERLGFKRLRVAENSWYDQLGEPQSAVEYEMYKEDFTSFLEK
jgi:RimJ/RimL family protein N-acetyltransferase